MNFYLFKRLAVLFALLLLNSCVMLFTKREEMSISIETNTEVNVELYDYNMNRPGFSQITSTVSKQGNIYKTTINQYKKDYYIKPTTKQAKLQQRKKGEEVTVYYKKYKGKNRIEGYDEIKKTNVKQGLLLKFIPKDSSLYSTVVYQTNGKTNGGVVLGSILFNLLNLETCLGGDLGSKVALNLPKTISFNLPYTEKYQNYLNQLKRDSILSFQRDSLIAIGKSSKIKLITSKYYFLSGESNKGGYAHGKVKIVSNDGYTIINGVFSNGNLISGTSHHQNGEIYEGSFSGFVPNGKGKFTDINNTIYDAHFVNGKAQGEAKLTYSDGSVFTGKLKNGLPDGKGKIIFPDKGYFIGEFINGLFNGHGELYKGDEKYIGKFKDGKPHGEGVYFDNGVPEEAKYYEGNRIDQAYLIKKEHVRAELARQHELKAEKERQEAIARELKQWEDQQRSNKILKIIAISAAAVVGIAAIDQMAKNGNFNSSNADLLGKALGNKGGDNDNNKGSGNGSSEDLKSKNKAIAESCKACPKATEYLNKLKTSSAIYSACYDQCSQLAYYNCLISKLSKTGQDVSTLIEQRKIIKQFLFDCQSQYKVKVCDEVYGGAWQ